MQSLPHVEHAASHYYSNNEDKFSFLVFDAHLVDSFFRTYQPIKEDNKALQQAFRNLVDNMLATETKSVDEAYAQHTDKPTPSKAAFAADILQATLKNDDENYFSASLSYLFYHHCLPSEWQYKWVQTQSGDFKFNVTFFNRLRLNCKIFDDHIYGNESYYDKNIETIFQGFIINEITAQKAAMIKDCILQSSAFDDKRLQTDKAHFITFLDNTITGNWRLFLLDKN